MSEGSLERVLLSSQCDEVVRLSILRHIASTEGAKKYHGSIGDAITPHRIGMKISEQPADFSVYDLPAGSKIGSRLGDVYTRQPDGNWMLNSGLSVSSDHFIKLPRVHSLGYVPTPQPSKLKTAAHRTKSNLKYESHFLKPLTQNLVMEAARKFGEMEPEATLTKKDMAELFVHHYLLGGAPGLEGLD